MKAGTLCLHLLLFYCLSLSWTALAFPLSPPPTLSPRAKFVLNNATGTPQVFNPTTQQAIPQGPATDGGGIDFSPAALIWVSFSFSIGLPMALAGIRGWRCTTGVAIGLSTAVCSWAALINSVNATGIPDAVLSALVLGFFALGFVLGVFEIGRIGGLALLGVTGGLAVGVRVMLLRPGLLFSGEEGFPANWVVAAFFGLVGGAVVAWPRVQRAGILFGSASVGTFLTFLGVDLVINKQSGMSRGLRFLFDRNSSHLVDILSNGYSPPTSTFILLGVSLALTPAFAYAQHRAFKHPFSRKPRPNSKIGDSESVLDLEGVEKGRLHKRQTFLSGLWDGARFKGNNSRFSV